MKITISDTRIISGEDHVWDMDNTGPVRNVFEELVEDVEDKRSRIVGIMEREINRNMRAAFAEYLAEDAYLEIRALIDDKVDLGELTVELVIENMAKVVVPLEVLLGQVSAVWSGEGEDHVAWRSNAVKQLREMADKLAL